MNKRTVAVRRPPRLAGERNPAIAHLGTERGVGMVEGERRGGDDGEVRALTILR